MSRDPGNKQGMTPMLPMLTTLAIGAAAGAVAVMARARVQLAAQRAEITALRAQLCGAAEAESQVAALRLQASSMRHDLRGILSPALLCADRLANSQDEAVRKAADIVIRSVERATARLADKTPSQEDVASVLE